MEDDYGRRRRSWVEEIEVTGNQLIRKIRDLIREGNVRRITIRNSRGRVLIELPLTAGLAVGTVAAVIAPILVALGTMAALAASFRIEVTRGSVEDDEV